MGNLFKIIISKMMPSKKDSIKEESSGDLEEKNKKFIPITLGDADYKDAELEKAFAPLVVDQESEEVKRLKNLAAKTKNKRIKKKLDKRIEKNT